MPIKRGTLPGVRGQQRLRPRTPLADVLACIVSEGGQYLLIQGKDIEILQRHIHGSCWQWQSLGNCPGQGYGIWESQFVKEEYVVALGAESKSETDEPCDFTIRIYDIPHLFEFRRFLISGKCFCYVISPDGKTVSVMSGEVNNYFDDAAPEYEITPWNVSTGQKVATGKTPSRKTNDLYHSPERMLFSPDGNWIAVNHTCHVELWDVATLLRDGV